MNEYPMYLGLTERHPSKKAFPLWLSRFQQTLNGIFLANNHKTKHPHKNLDENHQFTNLPRNLQNLLNNSSE
jgi:hypothetical protein